MASPFRRNQAESRIGARRRGLDERKRRDECPRQLPCRSTGNCDGAFGLRTPRRIGRRPRCHRCCRARCGGSIVLHIMRGQSAPRFEADPSSWIQQHFPRFPPSMVAIARPPTGSPRAVGKWADPRTNPHRSRLAADAGRVGPALLAGRWPIPSTQLAAAWRSNPAMMLPRRSRPSKRASTTT